MIPHNAARITILLNANPNILWFELSEPIIFMKARYTEVVNAINPIQEIRVPKGKADSLTTGIVNIGEPVTIRRMQIARIPGEIYVSALVFIKLTYYLSVYNAG